MTCCTCRHWLPIGTAGAGECHRSAPAPTLAAKKKPLVVVWPPMSENQGCGEWLEKPKAVVDVAAVCRN